MADRKPCQCGSNCAAIGCLDCCDCGAAIAGPIEKELRRWPSVDCAELESWLLSHAVSCKAHEFVTWTRRDDRQNIHDYAASGELPDVLSDAIEAAEALGL